jgi:hypothetical protein
MSPSAESRRRHDLLLGRALVRLLIVSIVLNALIFTAYVTSTPEESPRSTWLAIAYRAWYRIAPVDSRAQLSRMHLDSAEISTPECVACHGTMLDSNVAFHRIHLANELLPNFECSHCHARVDLAPRGNAAIVEWVDVGVCKECHSEFPGLTGDGSMSPVDFEIDCTMCHSGDHAFRHDAPYLSQIIAPRECKGCHGGRVLPWDPLHESPEWLQTHGTEALRSGTESCYSCHDFGLKFCDTCHKAKPPSHLPVDQWRNRHREAAKADTRACYTCHKLDFCKKCHLSHESGWKEQHPAFVKREGQAKCVRCHSKSFCSYCHTGVSASVATSGTP